MGVQLAVTCNRGGIVDMLVPMLAPEGRGEAGGHGARWVALQADNRLSADAETPEHSGS